MCRKVTGAPVVVWAAVPLAAFVLVKGTPSEFESSPGNRRSYCSKCGSQLWFRGTEKPYVEINTGTLDEPNLVPPGIHQFYANKVSWLQIDDELPRIAGGELPHPDRR